jgi:hypothetical protein
MQAAGERLRVIRLCYCSVGALAARCVPAAPRVSS